MPTYDVYWSPTGQKIATAVDAKTAKAAKNKVPKQFKRYKGEMYVVPVDKQSNPSKSNLLKKLRKGIRGTVRISRGRLLINPGGSAAGAGAGGAGGGAGAGSQGGRSSTEVRSPTRTSTSTEAETYGNVTVTGGAGAGANTNVRILKNPSKLLRRGIRGTVQIKNGRLIIKT
jgi:hypothetical protein